MPDTLELPFDMHRRTDPRTSRVAAKRHEPKLSERRRQVLELVRDNPDSTSGEIARAFAERHKHLSIRVAATTPQKRLPELEKLGCVIRRRPRECTDTGEMCATWRISDGGRRELAKGRAT